MAKAADYPRNLDVLANEMYRLLIKCGMHLDGESDWDPDDLRDAVAGIVLEMDAYYVRKSKEKGDSR
jgi:hypothetical protein